MPAYKYSMLFEYLSGIPGGSSNNRKAGWSESVYWNTVSSGALTSFRTLCQRRASLLPTYSQIVGIRRQQVDPIGSASTVNVNYPGNVQVQYAADIPQAALLVSIPATGVRNVRRYRITALVDDDVVRGEFQPQGGMALYNAFYRELNGWLMRGKDASQPFKNIATIDAGGNVAMTEDLPITAADSVFLRGVMLSSGKKLSGKFPLDGVTSLRAFKLRGWTQGAATLGSAQKIVIIYPAMNTSVIAGERIVVRKVGRPFQGYRGRRSKRRS